MMVVMAAKPKKFILVWWLEEETLSVLTSTTVRQGRNRMFEHWGTSSEEENILNGRSFHSLVTHTASYGGVWLFTNMALRI